MSTLDLIKKYLDELGFKMSNQKWNSDDMLIVDLEEKYDNFNGTLVITEFNINDRDIKTRLIQFLFEFKPTANYTEEELNSIILKKNKELPYGSFNIHNKNLFYKYITVFKKDKVEKEVILDIINVIYYIISDVIKKI